jgi:hypothetical protein
VDPEGRVALVAAAEKRDPLVDDGKACAADGVVVEWPAVDVRPLHEQVRESAGGAQLPELRPEATLEHRRVKIENALAFDERVRADGIVSRGKSGDLDVGPSSRSVSAIPLCCSWTSTMILTGEVFARLIGRPSDANEVSDANATAPRTENATLERSRRRESSQWSSCPRARTLASAGRARRGALPAVEITLRTEAGSARSARECDASSTSHSSTPPTGVA